MTRQIKARDSCHDLVRTPEYFILLCYVTTEPSINWSVAKPRSSLRFISHLLFFSAFDHTSYMCNIIISYFLLCSCKVGHTITEITSAWWSESLELVIKKMKRKPHRVTIKRHKALGPPTNLIFSSDVSSSTVHQTFLHAARQRNWTPSPPLFILRILRKPGGPWQTGQWIHSPFGR